MRRARLVEGSIWAGSGGLHEEPPPPPLPMALSTGGPILPAFAESLPWPLRHFAMPSRRLMPVAEAPKPCAPPREAPHPWRLQPRWRVGRFTHFQGCSLRAWPPAGMVRSAVGASGGGLGCRSCLACLSISCHFSAVPPRTGCNSLLERNRLQHIFGFLLGIDLQQCHTPTASQGATPAAWAAVSPLQHAASRCGTSTALHCCCSCCCSAPPPPAAAAGPAPAAAAAPPCCSAAAAAALCSPAAPRITQVGTK